MAEPKPISTSAVTEDPSLSYFRQWIEARKTCIILSARPGGDNFDRPETIAAELQQYEALDAMLATTPSTVEGIAALAEVLYWLAGPEAPAGSPEYADQCKEPAARLIMAIWRGAYLVKGRAA